MDSFCINMQLYVKNMQKYARKWCKNMQKYAAPSRKYAKTVNAFIIKCWKWKMNSLIISTFYELKNLNFLLEIIFEHFTWKKILELFFSKSSQKNKMSICPLVVFAENLFVDNQITIEGVATPCYLILFKL